MDQFTDYIYLVNVITSAHRFVDVLVDSACGDTAMRTEVSCEKYKDEGN